MAVQIQSLTNDAFRAFEQRLAEHAKFYELHEGIPFEMPSPSPLHNFIVARIVYFFIAYLMAHPIGYAFGDNLDFEIAPGVIYKPDAAFVSKVRFPELPTAFKGAPDLAVEVVSPGNSATEITRKVEIYLSNGAQVVWVIYPEERSVRVYRGTADGGVTFHRLTEINQLSGDAVLPGLSISISELFPE